VWALIRTKMMMLFVIRTVWHSQTGRMLNINLFIFFFFLIIAYVFVPRSVADTQVTTGTTFE